MTDCEKAMRKLGIEPLKACGFCGDDKRELDYFVEVAGHGLCQSPCPVREDLHLEELPECGYKTFLYPTGDAATKAFKEKLVGKGIMWGIHSLKRKGKLGYYAALWKFEGAKHLGHATSTTEHDALVAAVLAMPEEGK